MQLNLNKNQGLVIPEPFYHLLQSELATITPPAATTDAVTLNFRDSDYSAERGGYHPVEIRLEKHSEQWQLVYITDFSFSGGPCPELIKEIDISFARQQVFSLYGGWLGSRSGKELIKLFTDNFVEYHAMEVYNLTVSFD